MIIKSGNINLREVEEADTDYIVDLRSNPELNTFINQVTAEEHREWLKRYRADENDYYFVIEKKDGKRVGLIAIYDIDREKATGMFGRIVLEKRYGPLHAFEALFLILDFAFSKLRLDTVYADMQGDNRKVISFTRSFGFSLVKIEKKAYFNTQLKKLEDVYHHEISRETFNAKKDHFKSRIALLKNRLTKKK